jgi:UMF1 family MFS transporter
MAGPKEPLNTRENKRSIYSWAMYDWANSAFATTVIAGFFPIFFKQYWGAGADAAVSTMRLGTANSLSSIVVAVLAPVLGAIADQGSSKKKFLSYFAMMGIVMTGALFFVAKGAWPIAVLVYVTAAVGFESANSFYDSLLVSVASERRSDVISALGYAFGYLGGGLLFALNVMMTLKPELFGLRDAAHAVRLSFLSVAIWWAVFSIPILLFVKEPPGHKHKGWSAVTAGFRQFKATFNHLRELRFLFLMLLGYWFYIDGVHTITRMAVDYGLSLGFEANSLIVALLITQFVGFPAAIVFGRIGERYGAKLGIYIGIFIYVAVCIWAYFMKSVTEFYVLAATVGLVLGGIKSLSRSLYSRLIPRNNAAEFFGFYNMLGKFAAVIGPVLMGSVGLLTGNPRFSVLSVIVLFIIGAVFLSFVDETKGREAARRLETQDY